MLRALRTVPGLQNAPAYMCSADAMPEDVAKAHNEGFTGYWTKPIDIIEVTNILCRLATELCHLPHELSTRAGLPTRTNPQTAILLVNLGTPDEPTASALRRYLGQFLSDTCGRDSVAGMETHPAWHHLAGSPRQVSSQVRQHLDA